MLRKSAALLFLFYSFTLHAGGKSEPFQSVEGQENWQYTYDISKLETGKYNLIIQAEDKAGNIRVEGPFNINVDPTSDIPLISINSPIPGWRTTGKLNVVGSAVDDDEVDFVEVQLGTDGAVNRAVGTKYWSYYLDMTTLEDGPYTIRARAFDINGKVSPWSTVSFHLDQYKPVIQVTSHEMGALVKGGIRISGDVVEPNGINELYYSIGNQDQFQRISPNFNQTKKSFEFNFDLDTKRLSDGPQIVWIKAVNPLGNEGLSSFLFFVDNTVPKVDMYRPLSNQGSPGDVFLAGAVQEAVGLKRLTWAVDDKQGEIPLIPGNPYWMLNLDYSGLDTREKKIRFTAEDRIGNIGYSEFTLPLNRESDRPVISLDTPKLKDRLSGTVAVRGWIRDDDGAKSLDWTLTGGQKGTLETSGTFQFEVTPNQVGPLVLTLTAKDLNGLTSAPLTVNFDYLPQKPVIILDRVVMGTRKESFTPGFLLPAENKGERTQFLEGRVLSPDRLGQLVFTLEGGTPAKRPENINLSSNSAAPGTYTFSIPLSEKLGLGRNNFVLAVKDTFGNETSLRSFLLAAFNDLYNSEDSSNVFFLEDETLKNAKVNLREGESFKVLFYAERNDSTDAKTSLAEVLTSVDFNPASPLFSIESTETNNKGYLLTIRPSGSGVTVPSRIKVVTETGRTLESNFTLTLNSDFQAPAFELTSPTAAQWIQKTLVLKGRIQEPLTDLKAAEYSLDGVSWMPLPANIAKEAPKVAPVSGRAAVNFVAPSEDKSLIDTVVDISGQPDGNMTFHLRTVDPSGNVNIKSYPLFKDTQAPVVSMVTPQEGIKVNGLTTIIGEWSDDGARKSMEFSDDGKTYRPLETARQFKVDIDFSKYQKVPDKFFFRGTDQAGNVNNFEAVFQVDQEIDKPQVNLQIPAQNEVLRSNFFISGLLLDDDGVKEVYYRIDGQGEFKVVEAANSFQVPVSLNDITDTKHFVEVFAVDLNGTRGKVERRDFVVSRSGPTSLLLKPDVKITQKGKVILEGTSEDPNGVALVLISFDNGNTFYKMRGTSQWSYLLDTSIIADGIYTFLIRAVDTTGAVGDYTVLFSLDNTAPKLNVTSPKDGVVYANAIPLEGRGSDAVNLAKITYNLKALDAAAPAVSGELPLGQAFTTNVSIAGVKAGWYNLAVEAFDDAGNITLISRNIEVQDLVEADRIEVFFPVQGQQVSGPFQVQGRYFSKKPPEKALLKLNDKVFTTVDVDSYGYFSVTIQPSDLLPLLGNQNPAPMESQALTVQVEGGEGALKISSALRQVDFQAQGPWILVDSHGMGDFITNRPYMKGRVGYFTLPAPAPLEGETPQVYVYGDKKLTLEELNRNAATVELSMDNGVTFEPLTRIWDSRDLGVREWEYRLETQNFQQGDITILLRATFADGSIATSRQILTTDTIAPNVELLVPAEEGRFNELLKIVGAANDENGLKSVRVSLRKGDKVFTQVPSFIQGMYFDQTFLGATIYSTGLGVTFFDQAVKIQVNFGQYPKDIPAFAGGGEAAFFGFVYGGKLLANILTLPFGYIFNNPDLEWLGLNGAVGANFSAFSKDETSLTSEQLSIMGAIVTQVELKATSSLSFLKAYSVFGEVSLWFIPSEVKPRVALQYSAGFRITLL